MPREDMQIYGYKDNNYAVRLKVKHGRVIRVGYRRKSGNWYYVKPSDMDIYYKRFFKNGEPRQYKQVVKYVVDIIYEKAPNVFEELYNSIKSDDKGPNDAYEYIRLVKNGKLSRKIN